MAVAPDEFGRAVFTIETTSERDLRQAMTKSERVIDASTKRMEADFKKVQVAATKVQRPVASASSVFGAFAAQMSGLGGIVGGVGGKIAGLGTAFVGLGGALVGLPGILLLVTAGIGFFISKMISAKQKAKELAEEIEGIKEASAGRVSLLGGKFFADISRLSAMGVDPKDPLAVIRQKFRMERERMMDAVRELESRATGLGSRIAKFEDAALEAARKRNIGAGFIADIRRLDPLPLGPEAKGIQQEVALIQARVNVLRQIHQQSRENEKRDIARFREEQNRIELTAATAQAKKVTDARLAERQRSLQAFRATPFGQVVQAGFDILAERRRQAAVGGILNTFAGIIPADLLKQLKTKLGLTGSLAGARIGGGGGGFIELSAFAQTGAGRTGATLARDPVEVQRRQDERKRTDDGTEILESLRLIVKNFAPGAG